MKIAQLKHHSTGKLAVNPYDIAQSFHDYYDLLNNLKDNCSTPQPFLVDIYSFQNILPVDLLISRRSLKLVRAFP